MTFRPLSSTTASCFSNFCFRSSIWLSNNTFFSQSSPTCALSLVLSSCAVLSNVVILSTSWSFISLATLTRSNFSVKDVNSSFKCSISFSFNSNDDCPFVFSSLKQSAMSSRSFSLFSRAVVLYWRFSASTIFSFSVSSTRPILDVRSSWSFLISAFSSWIFAWALLISPSLLWVQASNRTHFSSNTETWFSRTLHCSFNFSIPSPLAFSRFSMFARWVKTSSSFVLMTSDACVNLFWRSAICSSQTQFFSRSSSIRLPSFAFSSSAVWSNSVILSTSWSFISLATLTWSNFSDKEATCFFKFSTSASASSSDDCPLFFSSTKLSDTSFNSWSLFSKAVVLYWRFSARTSFSFSTPSISSTFEARSSWSFRTSAFSSWILILASLISPSLFWEQASSFVFFSCDAASSFSSNEHCSFILTISSSADVSRFFMTVHLLDSSSSLAFITFDIWSSCVAFSVSWSSSLKLVLQSSSSIELNSDFSPSAASKSSFVVFNSSVLLSATEFACSNFSLTLATSLLNSCSSRSLVPWTDWCSASRFFSFSHVSSNSSFRAFRTADVCSTSLANFSFSCLLLLAICSCVSRLCCSDPTSSLNLVTSWLTAANSDSLLLSNVSRFFAFSCKNTNSFLVALHCSFISASFLSVTPLISSTSFTNELISSSLFLISFRFSSRCISRELHDCSSLLRVDKASVSFPCASHNALSLDSNSAETSLTQASFCCTISLLFVNFSCRHCTEFSKFSHCNWIVSNFAAKSFASFSFTAHSVLDVSSFMFIDSTTSFNFSTSVLRSAHNWLSSAFFFSASSSLVRCSFNNSSFSRFRMFIAFSFSLRTASVRVTLCCSSYTCFCEDSNLSITSVASADFISASSQAFL